MLEDQTIEFKGTTYSVADLSEKAKYIISQLQDLQVQITKSRNKLDQATVAFHSFENLLGKELGEKDD